MSTPDFRAPSSGLSGFGDMLDERLLRERIIWLEGEVRDENSDRIAKQLQVLAAEDHERDISLYINSPGGSITAGMVIYDTMQLIPNAVATVAMGLAAKVAVRGEARAKVVVARARAGTEEQPLALRVAELPRTVVVERSSNYLHAEASSAFFGFVDDLELLANEQEKFIQVRSVSRLGDSDLGVNSARLGELHAALSD